MSCNCSEINPCSQTPCIEVHCECPVLIKSDCVNEVTVDLPCLNISKKKTLNEWMLALDAAICAKFLALQSYFNLKNIGLGAKIYKQINLLGEKELRTIVSNDNSVIIEENSDNINFKITPTPFEKINEGNGDGIVIKGRDSTKYGNVGLGAFDVSSGIFSTNGATGNFSFSSGIQTEASGFSAVAINQGTIANGQFSLAQGEGTRALGVASFSCNSSTIANGINSFSQGEYSNSNNRASFSGGFNNITSSFGEACFGISGTIPTGSNLFTPQIPTDRLFNIGNGLAQFPISPIDRSDAFSVFKNGIATLPSVKNNLIDSANNKAIITKEYLQSSLVSGTTTVVSGNASASTPFKVEVSPSVISQINNNTSQINTINSNPAWITGDIKEIDCTDSYIGLNFTANGLGINERVGWAICNGNNGTRDRRRRVSVQIDLTASNLSYGGMGNFIGEETHTLTEPEMPVHSHNIKGITGGDNDDNNNTISFAGGDKDEGEPGFNFINTQACQPKGQNLPHNNVQPSIITLFIQKL
jgi:hypothetical protein